MSLNAASMKIRRGAWRIFVGKCEGKETWRGLVANFKVSSAENFYFNWFGLSSSKQGGKYLDHQRDLDFHRK